MPHLEPESHGATDDVIVKNSCDSGRGSAIHRPADVAGRADQAVTGELGDVMRQRSAGETSAISDACEEPFAVLKSTKRKLLVVSSECKVAEEMVLKEDPIVLESDSDAEDTDVTRSMSRVSAAESVVPSRVMETVSASHSSSENPRLNDAGQGDRAGPVTAAVVTEKEPSKRSGHIEKEWLSSCHHNVAPKNSESGTVAAVVFVPDLIRRPCSSTPKPCSCSPALPNYKRFRRKNDLSTAHSRATRCGPGGGVCQLVSVMAGPKRASTLP